MRQFFFAMAWFLLGILATIAALAAGWLDHIAPFRAPVEKWGTFPTMPTLKALPDGRMLQLLEDFVYIDPREKVWVCPKGATVDGASIPRAFWTIVGGPFDGKYRNASIVHDEACKKRTEPSEDVHYMFYEACRCGGLPEKSAKLIYAAVYHFGPRWTVKTNQEERTYTTVDDGQPKQHKYTVDVPHAEELQSASEPDQETIKKMERYINENNPSVDDLKKIDPHSLK